MNLISADVAMVRYAESILLLFSRYIASEWYE